MILRWSAILCSVMLGLAHASTVAAQEWESYPEPSSVVFNDSADEAPWRRLQVNALLLNRTSLPPRTLLADGTFTPLYDAQQINLPFQPGFEIDFQRSLGCNWPCDSIDARYFNVGGTPETTPELTTPGGAGVLFGDFPRGALATATAFSTLHYNSRLQSAELNFQHATFDNVTFLMGARYLNFSDHLLIEQRTNTGFEADHGFHGVNDLFGAQIGLNAVLTRCNRLQIDSVLKAGVYNNNAINRITYDTNFFNIHTSSGTNSDQTAFCGEAGLNLSYAVTDCLTLRGGYQTLWIDGIALASEQASVNSGDFTVLTSDIKTDSSLFYHGAMVGMEYNW
jgi:Putative beta barrel porin-7 (BBP7)